MGGGVGGGELTDDTTCTMHAPSQETDQVLAKCYMLLGHALRLRFHLPFESFLEATTINFQMARAMKIRKVNLISNK